MTLIRNLFVLGFALVVANAASVGVGRQEEVFQQTNGTIENNLPTVEPRNETPIELSTVEPRQLKIETNVKNGFSEKQILRQTSTAVCNGAAVSLQGTSSSNSVLVQSNNFPNKYLNNERCTYSLTVPVNSQVLINVLSLDVECPYDNVKFAFNNDPPVLNLCSSSSRSFTISPQTFRYTFKVIFSSDSSITFSGFQISLWLNSSATATTTTTPPITTTTTTTSITTTTRTTTSTTTNTARTSTATTTTRTTTTTTTPRPAGTCICGRSTARISNDEVGRIVGGSIAPPHSIPYQVGIWTQNSGNPFCGGTLISPNAVLTAAHCMPGFTAQNLKIAVNDVKYTLFGDGEKFINVQSLLSHPSYNPDTNEFDFAILRLASPAPISSTVWAACLPPDVSQTFAGTNLTISGWGTTSEGGNQSPDLKVSYVTGWTNADCNKPYQNSITANMICAATPAFNTDTCQGDSGGPLVATIASRATLVGVTSFGAGCAQSPYPGVYARVTAVKSWILTNSDAGTCQN